MTITFDVWMAIPVLWCFLVTGFLLLAFDIEDFAREALGVWLCLAALPAILMIITRVIL